MPFEKIVEELHPQRDRSRNPLFQVMFSYESASFYKFQLEGVAGREYFANRGFTHFDLNLGMREMETDLEGVLNFNTDLFEMTTAQRFCEHLTFVIDQLAQNLDQRLDRMATLPPTRFEQQLVQFNHTARPYSNRQTLHGLFEIRAAEAPEAVALVHRGHPDDQSLTYAEVNAQANRIAHALLERNIGRGDLVGVCFERSLEMVPALLGILKSGAAYVPMDPNYPAERIAYILEDTAARIFLTQEAIAANLPPLDLELMCLDANPLHALSQTNPMVSVTSQDLAYIIFTSGSTGRPKGVVLQHRPVVNLIEWVNTTYKVTSRDRLLFLTSLCFDLSVYDVFGILAAGATVYIPGGNDLKNPEILVEILQTRGITFWDTAPASLFQLVPFLPSAGSGSSSLRLAFNSGDWIPLSLPPAMKAAFPNLEFISLGGATEAAIWSNHFHVEEIAPEWKSIPYGYPIQNARYYVLDANLNPAPIGVAGDLYIGGQCLSLGYFKQPQLTADRYLPDPYSPDPGGVLYTTGDRARFMSQPDGSCGPLEFLGRLDAQVKIRGFRIELGEIETVLAEHPAIEEAVVLAREDQLSNKRLVAYVQSNSEPGPDSNALRKHIAAKVPEYMVPAAVVIVKQFPVTANGKLDRKALPAPESVGNSDHYQPPEPGIETELAAIWESLLGTGPIGRDHEFFELGGHSLLIMPMLEVIRTKFGVKLSVANLFEAPVMAELAEIIAEALV